MIFNERDITNEVILYNDLVAVVVDRSSVNVIKNNFNDVMGVIPLFLYEKLEEDMVRSSLEKPKTEEPKTGKPKEEEFNLDNLFDSFEDLFENFGAKVEPILNDVKDDICVLGNKIKKLSKVERLKSIRDMALEEGVATKGFIKKVNDKINKLKREARNGK